MKRLLTTFLFLAPAPILAAAVPLMPSDEIEIIEIRVPPQDLERCRATLAMVLLSPEHDAKEIRVETEDGPAVVVCLPE